MKDLSWSSSWSVGSNDGLTRAKGGRKNHSRIDCQRQEEDENVEK